MSKEFYQMSRWFNADGYQADIAGLRRDYPEIPLISFETCLAAKAGRISGRLLSSTTRSPDRCRLIEWRSPELGQS